MILRQLCLQYVLKEGRHDDPSHALAGDLLHAIFAVCQGSPEEEIALHPYPVIS